MAMMPKKNLTVHYTCSKCEEQHVITFADEAEMNKFVTEPKKLCDFCKKAEVKMEPMRRIQR